MKISDLSEIGEALSGDQLAVPERCSSEAHGDASEIITTGPRWYTVYTMPNHEKRVGEHFSHRNIEYFLPLYRVQRHWKNGLHVDLDLPLFPGYIFVRFASQHDRIRILGVPGVLWMVCGTGKKPTPLPDTEMNRLRAELHLRHAEPHPLSLTGQRVRIRCGALSGMEGILERWKNGVRVILTLELVRQSIAVEVNSHDLELL